MSRHKSQQSRSTPLDLIAVLLILSLANLAVFLPVVNESPLRAVFGLLFVLFVPGYALVAALFPESKHAQIKSRDIIAGGRDSDQPTPGIPNRLVHESGLDGLERGALSIALSIAVVTLLALLITVSPLPFGWITMTLSVTIFTVLCVVVTEIRRQSIPASNRFRIVDQGLTTTAREMLVEPESRFQTVLNVGVAVAVLFAVSSFGFAAISPPGGEQFTDFYVVSEQNDDSEPVAAEYPDTLTPGESETVQLGIENYEQESVEYSVVVQLQRVETRANDSAVTDRVEIGSLNMTLAHNDSVVREVELTPTAALTGEDLRLSFLLYKGSVPDEPRRENAYRTLHLWVDVQGSDR